MKKLTCYLEENICYGRDSKGKTKMLYAFQPLYIIKVSFDAEYATVKPKGRGNYREYLVKTNRLVWR